MVALFVEVVALSAEVVVSFVEAAALSAEAAEWLEKVDSDFLIRYPLDPTDPTDHPTDSPLRSNADPPASSPRP